jgi:hypothetical protein
MEEMSQKIETKGKPLRKKENMRYRRTIWYVQIYRLDDATTFFLNTTASSIWELCDGNHTIEQIAEIIGESFNKAVSQKSIIRDIKKFLNELTRERLIEWV